MQNRESVRGHSHALDALRQASRTESRIVTRDARQRFPAESFAYPFGSFDSTSEAVVHYCGYNSARTVAGVKLKGPAFGETVPPVDAYATRTPPNPKKATKLSTLEQYVLNADAGTIGKLRPRSRHAWKQR